MKKNALPLAFEIDIDSVLFLIDKIKGTVNNFLQDSATKKNTSSKMMCCMYMDMCMFIKRCCVGKE
jgi:hypothetical protein